MRYSLLFAGAATVSGMVIPRGEDYSQENVCKVEKVIVKLTPLDMFKGHEFELISPKKALEDLAGSLGVSLPNLDGFGDSPSPAESTFPTATPSEGDSGFGLGDLIPTGLAGVGDLIPGLGDKNPFESYATLIPELSTALEYLTKTPDVPLPTGTNSLPLPGASSAPFPVPGGSNSTALPTGSVSSSVPSSTLATSTLSTSTSTTSTSTSATPTSTVCASPKVRVEWRDMADSDKESYARAVKCLMDAPSKGMAGAQSRWEDLVALHQQQVDNVHGTGKFLPWHRYFLHIQESMLRTECAYAGPLPWWDETKDAGRFTDSPIFDSRFLGSAIEKTDNGLGACVSDGIIADTQLNVGPGKDNRAHCLSRAVDNELSSQLTNGFFAACNAHPKYEDMLNCAYPGPHGYGHNAIGAVMSDVASSPGDPVFYLHHAMIDRAWRSWQLQTADHLMAIGGPTTPGGSVLTTLQTTLDSMGIFPAIDVEQVMDTTSDYLCYRYSY